MNAEETIRVYFDALTRGDADRLIDIISDADHFVKIGTDAGEFVEGGDGVAEYYRHHVSSTEDFAIDFGHLDIQERESTAWFYTRQTWHVTWQGRRETLAMRLTGILEKEEAVWKFVQIHASIGQPT